MRELSVFRKRIVHFRVLRAYDKIPTAQRNDPLVVEYGNMALTRVKGRADLSHYRTKGER